MDYYIQYDTNNKGIVVVWEPPKAITPDMYMILQNSMDQLGAEDTVDFRLVRTEWGTGSKWDSRRARHLTPTTSVRTPAYMPQLAYFSQEEEELLNERERRTLITTNAAGLHLVGAPPPEKHYPVVIAAETAIKNLGVLRPFSGGDVYARYSPGAELVVFLAATEEKHRFTTVGMFGRMWPRWWSFSLTVLAKRFYDVNLRCSRDII